MTATRRSGESWTTVATGVPTNLICCKLKQHPDNPHPRPRRSYVLKSTSNAAAMRAEVEARKKLGWNRHGNFVLEVRPAHGDNPIDPFDLLLFTSVHRSLATKGPI